MKEIVKNAAKVEEVAENTSNQNADDEMNEIKQFIRKKQLQNKILKQITEKLLEQDSSGQSESKNAS